jgi:hypothetical protein
MKFTNVVVGHITHAAACGLRFTGLTSMVYPYVAEKCQGLF